MLKIHFCVDLNWYCQEGGLEASFDSQEVFSASYDSLMCCEILVLNFMCISLYLCERGFPDMSGIEIEVL